MNMNMPGIKEIQTQIPEKEIQEEMRRSAIEYLTAEKFVEKIHKGMKEFQARLGIIQDMVMNPSTWEDFRSLNHVPGYLHCMINGETRFLRLGIVAYFDHTRVWLSNRVLAGEIKFYGDEALFIVDFPDLLNAWETEMNTPAHIEIPPIPDKEEEKPIEEVVENPPPRSRYDLARISTGMMPS